MADLREHVIKFVNSDLELKNIWDVVCLLIDASITDGEHHKQYSILASLQILISKDKWEDFKDIYQPQDGIPD